MMKKDYAYIMTTELHTLFLVKCKSNLFIIINYVNSILKNLSTQARTANCSKAKKYKTRHHPSTSHYNVKFRVKWNPKVTKPEVRFGEGES